MPGYKGHLAGGLVTFGILFFPVHFFYPSNNTTTIFWLLCACAGSLFPDIDVKSKGQKYAYWAIFLAYVMLILYNKLRLLAILSLLCLTPMLVKHRGVFHRVSFVIGAPLIAWAIMSSLHPKLMTSLFFYLVFFTAGALSHLWLDFGIRRIRW